MSIEDNLKLIKNKILKNFDNVVVIAVVKKQSQEVVRAVVEAGVTDIGINYLQDYTNLFNQYNGKVNWHFIGNIQKKKLTKIVGFFDLIHSVSNLEVIDKVNQLAEERGIIQKVLLQINMSEEESKGGFLMNEMDMVFDHLKNCKNLLVKGLMTMPPKNEGKNYFQELNEYKKYVRNKLLQFSTFDVEYLSMGTSGDFVDAVNNGATHIRLGTVLLGERK